MKKFVYVAMAAALLLVSCTKDNPEIIPFKPVIRIGLLLPVTGTGSSVGQSSQAAAGLAVQDINTWLQSIGRNETVQLTVADTRTDTAEALVRLENMYWQGIRLVVGPYSSAEVAAVKPFADSHGMLVVSPASVALSLAIPGDNIFRFVSSDVVQGRAMSSMLIGDGVRGIAPLIRDDLWGNDLLNATSMAYGPSGATIHDAIRYDPGTTDFPAMLSRLDENVGNLLTMYPADQVGVYLCSYGEGTGILSKAGAYPHLNAVKWYGSSAFAQNAALFTDTAATGFAWRHGLSCPAYGLDGTARGKWEPLIARIRESIGREPEIYALTAYDAVWVGCKTYLATGLTPEFSTFRLAFTDEAGGYFGASGNTTLDENGDRAEGNYDFWAVDLQLMGPQWKVVAVYNSATGILTRIVK